MFVNFSVGASTTPALSKLDNYLTCPVKNVLNPLKWWANNHRVYPTLSFMALNYLCILRK